MTSENGKQNQPDEARIRFAPDILRRLGEELNPSIDQGILELAKNAYDADARYCEIELIDTDQPGGSVRVSDDGDGMDATGIADRWLVLGRSRKQTSQKTRLGRTPVGSKGLGRLAALRLGSECTLTSRPSNAPSSTYSLHIDWRLYDDVEFVEDIPLSIPRKARRVGEKKGTEIILSNLRERVGRMDVKRLARALILLADPFGDNAEGFKPVLTAPEFSDLEKMVQKRYFEEAEYHLIATVNRQGLVQAKVVDWKGQELFSAKHDEVAISRGRRRYECPAATFDLWAFILNKSSFTARQVTLQEVRAWLQEFGGVHLYQNGLRISPYGNPGNDWLDMNLRRAQIGEERPSTNNSLGRVSVFDTSDLLMQKTDRSGIIETWAFQELKEFLRDALEWWGRRRLSTAEERRRKGREAAPSRKRRSQRNVENAIEKLPEEEKVGVKEAFEQYQRDHQREIRQLHNEIQLYRTLSTAGITAATFAHESAGNPVKVITHAIASIERKSKKLMGDHYEAIEKPVESVKRATNSLSVLGTATLKLIDHEKRRLSRVDIHAVIRTVTDMFKPFFEGRDVSADVQFADGNPYLRGSEAAVESIVTNLINNSIAALEGAISDRRIRIATEFEGKTLTVRVTDSGPGIEGISKKDIWLPGQTTRKNGTGLGLTIVRDSVSDLGGTVDCLEHGDLGGAEIIIELPILGV